MPNDGGAESVDDVVNDLTAKRSPHPAAVPEKLWQFAQSRVRLLTVIHSSPFSSSYGFVPPSRSLSGMKLKLPFGFNESATVDQAPPEYISTRS